MGYFLIFNNLRTPTPIGIFPLTKVSALVVEEFREEEVGMYRCRVDFRTAQTRNTFINVSQIGEEKEAIVA